MITYKIYDEREPVSAGDVRIYNDNKYVAISNIASANKGFKGNIPVFNSNWNLDTSVEYFKLEEFQDDIIISIDLSVDNITFILPNPDKIKNKKIQFKIKEEAQILTISTINSSILIDGVNQSLTYSTKNDLIELYSDGKNYSIINFNSEASDNTIKPYYSGGNIYMIAGATYDITLTGNFFDTNINFDLGPQITINNIVSLEPDEVILNITANAIQAPYNSFIERFGIKHFGNSFTTEIGNTVVGTGVAGTWTTNFDTANNGQDAWDNNVPQLLNAWNLVIGTNVNSVAGFWVTSNAGTPSNNTGPSNPYDSYYIFGERSNPNNGANTDCYAETSNFRDLTQLSFYFHKFSNNNANMGDLVVYSHNPVGGWTQRWRHTGDEQTAQGDPFVQQVFNTTTWDCDSIRIAWENSGGWEGDIAIDDIEFISI